MKKSIFTLILLLGVLISFGNNKHDSLLVLANQQYDAGIYHEAIQNYQLIIDDNVESAQLYYNLGNTYYKIDDLASAILFYEKAKKLNPNDEDINYNLGIANSRIVDNIDSVPEIIFKRWWNQFYNMFSVNLWARVAIGLFILTLVFAAIYLLARTRFIKKLFFTLGVLFLLVSIASYYVSYQKYYYSNTSKEAILFAPTITIKSRPNRNSVDLFVIHEGTKIYILEQIGEWVEIRIANGSVGWLPLSEIKYI